MKNRLIRLTLVLLTVGAISFALVGVLHFLVFSTLELAQPTLAKTKPTLDRPARISFVRSAAAADLDGKGDTVADQVYPASEDAYSASKS
ncbi:hypothetical protein GC175_20170 [bacterium]|nr:hypothetical protein [bacterium]